MHPLAEYLLKTIAVSAILYGYYHFVLRDKRFHQWNRFYLLAATVLSVLIPLLDIPIYLHEQENNNALLYQLLLALNANTSFTEVTITTHTSFWQQFSWQTGLLSAYILILTVLLGIFTIQLYRIWRLKKRSPRQQLNNITLITTRAKTTPFSFFHWIFWNDTLTIESAEGQHVFKHELTHVRQWHSADKLLLQLLCIAFWPVVFFYFIRRELQIIHEYLADQRATHNQDISEYATVLLQQAFGASQYAFTNSFFQHPLKRRIAMMTNFSKPSFVYLRKVAILPIAVSIFGLLAFKIRHQIAVSPTNAATVIDSTSLSILKLALRNDTSKPSIGITSTTTRVDNTPLFPGGNKKWNEHVLFALTEKHNTNTSLNLNGTATISFLVDAKGGISQLAINQANNFTLAHAVMDIIQNGPHWIPARSHGKSVPFLHAVKVKYGDQLNDPSITNDSSIGIHYALRSNMKAPLVLLDGKKINDLNSLDPNIIETISVLKDASSRALYGDAGANGVILVTAKTGHTPGNDTVIRKVNGIKITGIRLDTTGKQILPASTTLESIIVTGRRENHKEDSLKEVSVVGFKETKPRFPGGDAKWNEYINKVFAQNMDALVKDPQSRGTCEISFVVHANGKVSDIQVLSMQNTKLAAVCINAIKKGPRYWEPGTYKDQTVTAIKRIKCNFQPDKE